LLDGGLRSGSLEKRGAVECLDDEFDQFADIACCVDDQILVTAECTGQSIQHIPVLGAVRSILRR
jgi:hypothetical protein